MNYEGMFMSDKCLNSTRKRELRMEAARTLAQTLSAGGSHGGSDSPGGIHCDERLRPSAVRNDNHERESGFALQKRGRGGYKLEWDAQRISVTEAASSDAEEPGYFRFFTEIVGLVRGRDKHLHSMHAVITIPAHWNVAATEVPRAFGLDPWVWFLFDYLFKSRTFSLCILPFRLFAEENSSLKEVRALPPGENYGRQYTDKISGIGFREGTMEARASTLAAVAEKYGRQARRALAQALLRWMQRLKATFYACNAENLWTMGVKEKGTTCRNLWSLYAQVEPQARRVRTEADLFQIFVKTPNGKTLLLWVSAQDTGETLKTLIEQREGYPGSAFYLLCEGKALKAEDRMGECQIHKNSTIQVMYRLRGGSDRNRGSAGPSSYKDAARPKGSKSTTCPPSTTVPMSVAQPRPYIVEKLDEIPSLEIKNPEVKQLFKTLQTHALICRFNGFWPRSYDLHNWIYTNWTIDCQILLCSKGFFTVQFEKLEDCQKVISQGPWFWGRAGLFLTPWFPEFDANSMVVTKMPVWVRLPNLPLPFWHHMVLEDIGNLLGTYIKRDPDRNEQGLFTYARICVEIDLSKGLPDRIHLQYEKLKWLQLLDYENTAFRCRFCHDTGHLQDTCPLAKRYPKKKKGTYTKGKTWQSDYAPQCNEDSEVEESEPEEQQEKEERVENWQNPETLVERKSETKSVGKETPMEDGKSTVHSMADHIGEGSQTAIVTQEKVPASGVKRGHESEKSDSDKEHPTNQKPEMVNGRQLVIATSSQGKWVEVKNKRKGKKGKIEDYYQH